VRCEGTLIILPGIRQNLRVKIAEHKYPTDAQRVELVESRRKMSKALDAWYSSLADFMPADALQEVLGEDSQPEKELLRLPSDFPQESHPRLGLTELADIERQLRVGQAHDALRKLRTMLGLKSFLVKRKYKTGGGQRALTRSEADIGKAGRQVTKWKEVYQRCWRALERLRGAEAISEHEKAWLQLRELKDGDCVMLSEWIEEHRYWRDQGERKEAAAASKGKGRQELPWIWKLEFELGDAILGGVDGAIEGWTEEGKNSLRMYQTVLNADVLT
jgi:hypothetical protein